MSGLQVERTLTWRAPVKGAWRRMSSATAYRDWAKHIVREAPCRGVWCSSGDPEVGLAASPCDRHGDAFGPIVSRLARLLERWHPTPTDDTPAHEAGEEET